MLTREQDVEIVQDVQAPIVEYVNFVLISQSLVVVGERNNVMKNEDA